VLDRSVLDRSVLDTAVADGSGADSGVSVLMMDYGIEEVDR